MLRLVMLALLLFPALCLGQAQEGDAEKVSNDQPGRPLQMPPASSEVKEAFDDFERFRRRGAWERAFKALYSIPEAQASRFVDGEDGFIIPVARRHREVLAGLSPEGMAAYRLFYDAEAKKLLDEAEGPAELETLERLYSAYVFTSVGDEAADRLGDLYFQLGRFDRAAECWQTVLERRPDSELSRALLSVKAALALARAGRPDEVEPIRRALVDRDADEPVTVGGRTAPAAEQLDRLLAEVDPDGDGASESAASAGDPSGLDLPDEVEAAWQVRFADLVVAGMSPAELTQWESNPLSAAIPAVAIAGDRLYASYLGFVIAVDLPTGKLLWRSGSFHNVEIPARQQQVQYIDPGRFAILASGDRVWDLGRDLLDQNQQAPFRLTCRRADRGDVVWRSTDLPDFAMLDLVGAPILVDETIFVAARTQQNPQQRQQQQLYVLAVRAGDGKVRWKAEVGAAREGRRYSYYGMPDSNPQPRIAHRSGAVFVDSHVGVLARLDAETGAIGWGYGYKTQPVQSSHFFSPYRMSSEPSSDGGAPVLAGATLLVKGEQSDRLGALDPDRVERLWERPIATSARLLGADDRSVFLGGPELAALDRESRELSWATRLPGGSGEARVLVRPGGLWQMTPRGIFEVDPASGRVRRILRGDDSGSVGGDLYLADRLLVAVTNQTISAYPTGAAAPRQADRAGAPGDTTNAGGSDD